MWKLDLLEQLDPMTAADAKRRRRPFADTIERNNRRFLERAGEERARGMAFVMIRKDDWRRCRCAEPLAIRPSEHPNLANES